MADSGSLVEELNTLESEGLTAVQSAATTEGLERVRIEFLGRREGRVSRILRRVGELSPAERPEVGATANRVKERLHAALEVQEASLGQAVVRRSVPEDLTLPSRGRWVGGRHPVTLVIDDLVTIFRTLGFTLARGTASGD